MPPKTKLAVIYGSARQGRFCDVVAKWVASEIRRHDHFALELVDPRDLGHNRHDIAERLGDADAFIIVTPEYNHGYTADLKALIDAHSVQWQAKPLAFVSYGGISGGLRAIEQLRLVFAELHVVAIRDTVSFAFASKKFDASGALIEPGEPRRALAVLLARLQWWAINLREARANTPYIEVAA
ncbi:NADPH-dependent FMN reductase [Aminobacter aganoensis]|uniref:NAD(P)H-dependent FMN reductase n=1 Tax=Aminobacter aganoensis TaxID=83264 RepID=A0A7X0FB25_9HYPH|nr:NAD(P)H-dependent oxidoreductase [Aminobacter aganoensis]MBB6356395.1 NAD(P)H-dependent FMN reductase [Aminobacter aganoensis]